MGGLAVEYRNLGRSGLLVSLVGLGCDNFGHRCDPAQSTAIVEKAIDFGITLFDTADIYGPGGLSEEYLGKALSGRRHDAVIATKFVGPTAPLSGPGLLHMGTSRRHIMNAVEASLRRLGTDYIDLYQIHFPFPGVPMEETLRTLDDLVHQGKVRYIGCSNYPAWRLMQALWTSDKLNLARYDVIQPHYSMVHRDEFERELADVCLMFGIGVIPYSPLEGGFLTGKYRQDKSPDSARQGGASRYFTDKNWALLEIMDAISKEKNCTVSQVALAWQLANPIITSPIIGPRDTNQLNDNLGSVEITLSDGEIESLNKASDWKKDK